jgi:hypothetical protein
MKSKYKIQLKKIRRFSNVSIIKTCVLLTLITLCIFNFSIYFFRKPAKITIPIKTDNRNVKLKYWNDFLSIHEDYYYGWIELAKLEFQGNNVNQAVNALEHAYNLNPNSSEVQYYRLIINKER